MAALSDIASTHGNTRKPSSGGSCCCVWPLSLLATYRLRNCLNCYRSVYDKFPKSGCSSLYSVVVVTVAARNGCVNPLYIVGVNTNSLLTRMLGWATCLLTKRLGAALFRTMWRSLLGNALPHTPLYTLDTLDYNLLRVLFEA